MERNFTLHTVIKKPVAEVFAAIVEPKQLTKYFAGASSGPLVPGQTIEWSWEKWGVHPVTVTEISPNNRTVLTLNSTAWKKTKGAGYDVTVTFEFESLDEQQTMLTISEQGWKTDPEGLKASHENCGGWQHMALCLKAYLEHGVDLRD